MDLFSRQKLPIDGLYINYKVSNTYKLTKIDISPYFDSLSNTIKLVKDRVRLRCFRMTATQMVDIMKLSKDANLVDFAIPANDDATRSIDFIVGEVTEYIKKGLTERKAEKARSSDEKIKKAAAKKANVDEAPAPAPVAEKPAKEEAPKAEAAPVAEKPAKKAAPKKAAVKAEKATETPEVKEEVKTEE